MLARLSAFVIWALVSATAVFWGLRLLVRAPAPPAYALAVGDAAAARGDLTRLFGKPTVAPTVAALTPAASSRFRLLGIVAPDAERPGRSHSTPGVALIAVDGKMPKAVAVGTRLDGDLVLQSVSLRTVAIGRGQGAPSVTLELPRPSAATTGSLSPAPNGGQPGMAAAPPVYAPSAFVPQAVPSPDPVMMTMPAVPPPGTTRTNSGLPSE